MGSKYEILKLVKLSLPYQEDQIQKSLLDPWFGIWLHGLYLGPIKIWNSLYMPTNALDVLWGQPIKQNQVASTSEFHENQRNDILFFEIFPCHFCRASEVQT